MRGLPQTWGQGCASGYILANLLERIGRTPSVLSLACKWLSSKAPPQTQPDPKPDLQPAPIHTTFRGGLQPGSCSGGAELPAVVELRVVTGQGCRSRTMSAQLGFSISLLFNLGQKSNQSQPQFPHMKTREIFLPTVWFAVRHVFLFES